MLLIARECSEAILLRVAGQTIRVVVVSTSAGRCRLGIEADRQAVQIVREELTRRDVGGEAGGA